jgi:hypothetical protein
MSVRKIPPNRRSITGHVPSRKKPGMLAYESKLERDLYILLEFDSAVRTVHEQPVRISFVDRRGRLNHYTPDCEVHYVTADGLARAPALLEVKERSEILERWAELHPKFRAAARYARNRGYVFRLITEREISGPRLRNASWLFGYRALPIPLDEVNTLLHLLRTHGGCSTPSDIVNDAAQSSEGRQEFLVSLWYAIANGHILFNWDAELNMSSRIWSAPNAPS